MYTDIVYLKGHRLSSSMNFSKKHICRYHSVVPICYVSFRYHSTNTDWVLYVFFFTTDINECLLHRPCKNGALCTNTYGSYYCTCTFGYNGFHCENGKILVVFSLFLFWAFLPSEWYLSLKFHQHCSCILSSNFLWPWINISGKA